MIINFEQIRAERLEQKRRATERVTLKEMLGIYCVLGNEEKLVQIDLIDLSEEGIAFKMVSNARTPTLVVGDALKLRLYFNQDMYLPLMVRIRNSTDLLEERIAYCRVGCSVDSEQASGETFRSFVHFVKLFSEAAYKDTGKIPTFYSTF